MVRTKRSDSIHSSLCGSRDALLFQVWVPTLPTYIASIPYNISGNNVSNLDKATIRTFWYLSFQIGFDM